LGLIEMRMQADGEITQIEQSLYTAYARQSGLIDDLAVQQSGAVSTIFDLLEQGLVDGTEATNMLLDTTRTTVDAYATAEMTAVPALENVALATEGATTNMQFLGDAANTQFGNIEGSARSSVGGIDEAAAAVNRVRAAIDLLQGKEIEIKTVYVEEHRAVGGGGGTSYRESGNYEALGGDYYVDRPTTFIAGDAGGERAIFIPKGKPGYDADLGALLSGLAAPLPASGAGVTVAADGGTRIGAVNLTVNGTSDARETARLVMREFQDRGFIPRIPLR